ncbi:MAG: DMP19 family protein [Burkholderiales bacterium]|jgi:hypothetical protein|nr:DMP19 family protein [Burkholderiales bacterium]
MPIKDMFPYGKTVVTVMKQRGNIDEMHLNINIGAILTEKVKELGIDALSQEERYVYAVQGMDKEVNNGGFELYFYNEAGMLATELPQALEAIGLPANLTIAKEALRRFGTPSSWANDDRRAHLEKIFESGDKDLWESVDAAYYEYPEIIEEKLLDYIEEHIEKFK